ncbi:MAG: hypothetical protein ACRYFU_22680 [Janthinobacterium lividum]
MIRLLRLLRSYVFWSYERGSFHYDVMVTLILLFLFLSPHLIDFHDRPIPEVPKRSSEVLVRNAGPEGAGRRFVYEIRADDLQGAHSAAELQDQIAATVHAIAGDAQIENVKPVADPHGRIVAYDATVRR